MVIISFEIGHSGANQFSEPTALAAGFGVGRFELQDALPTLMPLDDFALKLERCFERLKLRNPRLAPSAHRSLGPTAHPSNHICPMWKTEGRLDCKRENDANACDDYYFAGSMNVESTEGNPRALFTGPD